jgi:hypothetical protein
VVTGGSVTGGSVTGGSVTGGVVTGGSVTGGVVSGASAASIAVVLFSALHPELAFWLTLSLTALVSSVTVGGKALGKKVGMDKNREITLSVAHLLCLFTRKKQKDRKK